MDTGDTSTTPRRPRVVAVVAAATNGVIGRDGAMPWHLPEDFKHFKRTTMGRPMIMGRKTWESLGARPLPGRQHIVVSRQPGYEAPGATVAPSLDAAFAAAGDADPVMVIGGAEIFAQALPRTDEVVLSRVHLAPEGDTYFPDLDPQEWRLTSEEPHEGFDVLTWVRR